MKTKKFRKKLVLNKATIINLTPREMSRPKAGLQIEDTWPPNCSNCKPCNTGPLTEECETYHATCGCETYALPAECPGETWSGCPWLSES
jgi:hypothetical protein